MAPTLVGIDLGPSPIKVGGMLLGKFLVFTGKKGVKVDGSDAPNQREVIACLRDDANAVVKSNMGAGAYDSCVVVVPNTTSDNNREKILAYARNSGFQIPQLIGENLAVAYAYWEKVQKYHKIVILSLTTGKLDVSVVSITPPNDPLIRKYDFYLRAHTTYPNPIEFQPTAQSSGEGGLVLGLIGGVTGVVSKVVNDSLSIVNGVLGDVKIEGKVPVTSVVLVGKDEEGLKQVQQAAKERFPGAVIWDGVYPDEVAAYGAAAVAFRSKTVVMKLSSPGQEDLVDVGPIM